MTNDAGIVTKLFGSYNVGISATLGWTMKPIDASRVKGRHSQPDHRVDSIKKSKKHLCMYTGFKKHPLILLAIS